MLGVFFWGNFQGSQRLQSQDFSVSLPQGIRGANFYTLAVELAVFKFFFLHKSKFTEGTRPCFC